MAMMYSKAQLFSMIALMMSLFFILLFSTSTRVPLDNDAQISQSEIAYLNDIILDFPILVESAAETTSLLILNFSVSHLNGTNYFPDFQEFFDSCFDSGTFYDYNDSITKLCSEYGINVSFRKRVEDVFALTGDVYNLDIFVSNITYSMSPFDAYSLDVKTGLLVRAKLRSQKKNLVWERLIDTSAQVDYIGITDPASIGTNHPRIIKPYWNPSTNSWARTFTRVGFEGDVGLIQTYIDEGAYFVDQTGPSFFERMQGNKTKSFDLVDSHEYGLGSILPAYNRSGDSLYLGNISMIDHHYDWGATPSPALLRFFNSTSGINRNITLYRTYAIQGLGLQESDLELVLGNCDASGCDYP